jgi:hypothetical protein
MYEVGHQNKRANWHRRNDTIIGIGWFDPFECPIETFSINAEWMPFVSFEHSNLEENWPFLDVATLSG